MQLREILAVMQARLDAAADPSCIAILPAHPLTRSGDSYLSPATVDCAPFRSDRFEVLNSSYWPVHGASALRASSVAAVSLLNGVNVRAASRGLLENLRHVDPCDDRRSDTAIDGTADDPMISNRALRKWCVLRLSQRNRLSARSCWKSENPNCDRLFERSKFSTYRRTFSIL
jgi:hypothetical protein